MQKRIYLVLFLFGVIFRTGHVHAISCVFSGADGNIPLGGTSSVSITLTNSGPETGTAFQVTNSGNEEYFILTGGDASGWTTTANSGTVTFSGASVDPSNSVSFSVQMQGNTITESSLGITAYISMDGSSFEECSGGINVNVIEPLPTSTPSPTTAQSAPSSNSSSTSSSPTSTPTPGSSTTTVTKTVIITDTVAPTVQLSTKLEKSYQKAPIIEGIAIDSGAVNVGISKIQYSTDAGRSWLTADDPNGAITARFSFLPELDEDGNYSVVVRAIDRSGNRGTSSTLLLVIDRLPPRIIHSLWHVGPIVLHPDGNGVRTLGTGVPARVVIQAVGGVTELRLKIGEEIFPFTKNWETGLWEGEVKTEKSGIRDVQVTAVDGGKNSLTQTIGSVAVSSTRAQLQPKSAVLLMRFNPITAQYVQWNGTPYSQVNPHEGQSDWFLPPGKYIAQVTQNGYRTAESEILVLQQSGIVHVEVQLDRWVIWDLFREPKSFTLQAAADFTRSTQKLTGEKLKWVQGTEWEGKEIRVALIPAWDAESASFLHRMTEKDIVIVPGMNASAVSLLKARGGYYGTFIADPDGESLADLQNVELPVQVGVNRKGVVESVLY